MAENITYSIAFAAGLLSFLSPCILPLIPAYLGYLTGSAAGEHTVATTKSDLLFKSLAFVVGFSIIFIAMGATASTLGELFSAYREPIRITGGIIIIILGIHMTGIIKLKPLYMEKRLVGFTEANRKLGPVFIGMAFAAGWTPCIGPVLASILIYAGSMETVSSGIILLSFYSLGLGIPFLAAAFILDRFSGYFRKVSRYLGIVSLLSGILLILTGILVLTNKLVYLTNLFYA